MRIYQKPLDSQNKQKKPPGGEEPTVVELYEEARPHWKPMNKRESAFSSVMGKGLNQTESVYDRQAIFRTSQDGGKH